MNAAHLAAQHGEGKQASIQTNHETLLLRTNAPPDPLTPTAFEVVSPFSKSPGTASWNWHRRSCHRRRAPIEIHSHANGRCGTLIGIVVICTYDPARR